MTTLIECLILGVFGVLIIIAYVILSRQAELVHTLWDKCDMIQVQIPEVCNCEVCSQLDQKGNMTKIKVPCIDIITGESVPYCYLDGFVHTKCLPWSKFDRRADTRKVDAI